jgi:hypothetical protein
MADYFVAISEDGVRFKLKRDGTWEPDVAVETESTNGIRFRSSNWGECITEVKKAEKGKPEHETDDWLLYRTQIAGFPADLSFNFVNGMLFLGMYVFKQEHTDDNKFLDDFESVQALLTTKYGAPHEIKDIWLNDLYRDDYEARGMAVSRGDHSIFVNWIDDETSITLQLTGDNYEIRMGVLYRSNRLEPLAKAAMEREKLEGL